MTQSYNTSRTSPYNGQAQQQNSYRNKSNPISGNTQHSHAPSKNQVQISEQQLSVLIEPFKKKIERLEQKTEQLETENNSLKRGYQQLTQQLKNYIEENQQTAGNNSNLGGMILSVVLLFVLAVIIAAFILIS